MTVRARQPEFDWTGNMLEMLAQSFHLDGRGPASQHGHRGSLRYGQKGNDSSVSEPMDEDGAEEPNLWWVLVSRAILGLIYLGVVRNDEF